YILDHADMPGFSRTDQQHLAMLVLAHRGDLKKIQDMIGDKPQQYLAVMALRLATLFCRGRKDFRLPEKLRLNFDLHQQHCDLSIDRQWLAGNPLTAQALVFETDAWQKIGVAFQIRLLA
ncbi:MAG: exopolyphosphatase, partial [Neisseriaceae bacterium]|nr:exopolyphosphatase [Neisseriaceae bacterium]